MSILRNKTTAVCAAALVLLLAALPATAFDAGATLSNGTEFYSNDFSAFSLTQQETLTAWARHSFSQGGQTYLVAEGSFAHKYQNQAIGTEEATSGNTLIADLTLLKFAHSVNFAGGRNIQLAAGRISVSDSTSVIFSQAGDGASVQYASPRLNASAFAAYTGLLNAQNITILDISETAAAAGGAVKSAFDSGSYGSAVYYCNSPYLVASASVAAPYIVANQTLVFEVLGAFGIPGITANNSGYNRAYATLLCNGPILANLFYTASTTLGTENFTGISNLSKLSLFFYPGALSSSVWLNALYASGANGSLVPFRAVTSSTATLAYDQPEYTGLLKAGLGGSIKPLSNLLVSADAAAVFGCEKSFAYGGFQIQCGAAYQAFTDLSVELSAQYYLGADSASNKFLANLSAVIAF